MRVNNYHNEVSPGLLSKAAHALGLEQTVPQNDKVYSIGTWEALVEAVGRSRRCSKAAIERAKAQYTYYMLYHYAPSA
jgi:hypothetical protein